MSPLAVPGILLLLGIVYVVLQSMRAGPIQLDPRTLSDGRSLRLLRTGGRGDAWMDLGSRTAARGMDLRFDHDDDPQAEASFPVDETAPGHNGSTFAQCVTVRLSADFEEHHVHTRGYVFRLKVRGTAPVVGKEIRIMMRVRGDGQPVCGHVENDDDTDAAVGAWIEFEELEILDMRGVEPVRRPRERAAA